MVSVEVLQRRGGCPHAGRLLASIDPEVLQLHDTVLVFALEIGLSVVQRRCHMIRPIKRVLHLLLISSVRAVRDAFLIVR